MRIRLLAAICAAALSVSATAASAAITVVSVQQDQLFNLDSGVMLWDFDGIANSNTNYSHAPHAAVPDPFNVSDSAPPPYDGPGSVTVCCQNGVNYEGDHTQYASVQNEETPPGETFSALNGWYFTSFSFYLGSPDTYNVLTFKLTDGSSQVFTGPQIWDGADMGGDRTKGFRVYYDFGGAKVSSINFQSVGQDAFEFDGLAGTLAVPEPTTWAMMILGFGAAGSVVRRRRALAAA